MLIILQFFLIEILFNRIPYTEKVMPLDKRLEGDNLSEMWKDASRWKTEINGDHLDGM